VLPKNNDQFAANKEETRMIGRAASDRYEADAVNSR